MEKNPNANYIQYMDAVFPLIESGTFGEDFFFQSPYSVWLDGPADYNQITVEGDVGIISNNDGWNNLWKISGEVGRLGVFDSIGTSFLADSVQSVWAEESLDLSFHFTVSDSIQWDDVDKSSLLTLVSGDTQIDGDDNEINLGLWAESLDVIGNGNVIEGGQLGNGSLEGDQNTVDFEQLTEGFSVTGQGNLLDFGNAEGTQIMVGSSQSSGGEDILCELLGICDDSPEEAVDTFIFVTSGDTEVVDHGTRTTIRLGDGNDDATLRGNNTILNMGDGFDFVRSSADNAVVSNAEYVTHESGNLTLTDVPLWGQIEVAGNYWDMERMMIANGINQDGHAVLTIDDNVLTVLNGAQSMLPEYDLVA